MKKPDKGPTRREALQALESMCMGLVVWRGSWGSVAEPYCLEQIRQLANQVYKGIKPQGMLHVQQTVLDLCEKEAARLESNSCSAISTEESVEAVSEGARTEKQVGKLSIVSETDTETGLLKESSTLET